MTTPEHHREDGADHEIGRLVGRAYHTPVDVETASRHLWRLHQVARGRQVRGARRTLVSALAAVLLFATTGTAVALSGQAVPGDSLYPVKRSAERIHLLVSFAPDSDARLHLRFARSRVAEAEQVAAAHPEAVGDLLSEIVESVDRASAVGGEDLSDEVDLVRREAATALSSLSGALDTELAASLEDTIRALDGEAVAAGGDQQGGDEPGGAQQGGDDAGGGQQGGDEAGGGEGGADGAASEPGEPGGEPASPEPTPATAPDASAAISPDGATPPPATPEPGRPDGDEPEGGGAGTPEPTASPHPTAAPAAPSGDTEGDTEPASGEVAAEGTMPRLERLEGLLRGP